jgi:hypothetical protein
MELGRGNKNEAKRDKEGEGETRKEKGEEGSKRN